MEALSKLWTSSLSWLRNAVNELKRLSVEGKWLGAWIVGVIFILAICLALPFNLPNRVRWAGIVYELVGISTIAIGLSRARLSFGKPSLLWSFLGYLWEARYIFVRRPSRHIVMAAGAGSLTLSGGRARMTVSGSSLDRRVAQLEHSVGQLEKRADESEDRAKKFENETKATIETEADERRKADQNLHTQLENSLIGGIQLETSGLGFLVLGILFANAPDGTSQVLRVFLAWIGITLDV